MNDNDQLAYNLARLKDIVNLRLMQKILKKSPVLQSSAVVEPVTKSKLLDERKEHLANVSPTYIPDTAKQPTSLFGNIIRFFGFR